jgi:hypothetical protein
MARFRRPTARSTSLSAVAKRSKAIDEPDQTLGDEETTSTSTPAAPSPTPAPSAPSSALPSGPITRARAREFNCVMMLKNEGPKD